METQILAKANEVIKDSSFTKLVKRSKVGNCFLIVTTPNFDLYGSFSSLAVYATSGNDIYLLR
jgi:hypothetical protein